MSATEMVHVGDPMPRLAEVSPQDGYSIAVTWAEGDSALVDLAPDILTYKFYRPLRDDPKLFASVHLVDDGRAIAWGDDEAIDMPATSVERLAEETMTAADFGAFLERTGLTFDAAAVQLGISRRLVAYYAGGRTVPRYIALACRYLEQAHPAA